MYGRIGRIHFVGIGGTGMNGIAEVLLTLGYKVSGSDLSATPVTERLQTLGGLIYVGHAAENVRGCSVVVISSAVRPDNPEVVEARAMGIPVIPRAEMLAELMRVKYGVAVAGAHGKTTTTSMVAAVLTAGGLDPTIVVGGRVKSLGSNARLGEGDFLVAEADESDGSFLRLTPSIAVITNIDEEHLDYWKGGINEIRAAFIEFANKVPFYGVAIVCLDDPEIQKALPGITRRLRTYGMVAQADLVARSLSIHKNGGAPMTRFEVVERRTVLGTAELHVAGQHNVLNALAAIAVGRELELEFDVIRQGLADFQGVGRRFEPRGEARGVKIFDDYGHHPTEVSAVLRTAKESYGGRTLVAFQPHRYTRTRDLLEQFGRCFHEADHLYLLPIYAAGEAPIEGISSERILEACRAAGHKAVDLVQDQQELAELIAAEARDGDIIITLGAGDVTKAPDVILARLAGGGVMFGRRTPPPAPAGLDLVAASTLDAEARRARAALDYLRRTDRRPADGTDPAAPGTAGREWRELRRRRRQRTAARVAAWVTTLAIVLALGGGGWFGGRAAFGWVRGHTDTFRVRQILVTGTERLTRDEIVDAAGVAVGQDLLALRPDTLCAAVARLPRVKRVTADRTLRRELKLNVEERHPCALLLLADTWEVDADGVLLPADGTGHLADLPVIVGLPADSARAGTRPQLPGLPAGLRLAGRLAEAGLLDAVSDIDVTRPDSLVLILQPGGVAVRAGDGDLPVRRLLALAAVRDNLALRKIDPAYIDIRFSGLVAVKPADDTPEDAEAPAATVALASVTPVDAGPAAGVLARRASAAAPPPPAAGKPPAPRATGVLSAVPKAAVRPPGATLHAKSTVKIVPKQPLARGKTVTGKAGRKPAPKKPAQGQRRPHGQHT